MRITKESLVSFGGQVIFRRTILSYLLLPFALLYSGILKIRRIYYLKNPQKIYHSRLKIISVGNLIIGGSGKTPFTIFLANMIKELGFNVAVSHRGYKGSFENKPTIISDTKNVFPEAENAGDEPFLIAQKLNGIPVIAGRDRTAAIKLLEKNFPKLDFVILDDSFQHLKVRHHHDFLLFKDFSRIKNRFLIPAGPFREPISAVKKADTLVFINDNPSADKHIDIFGKANNIRGSFKVTGFFDLNNDHVSPETLRESKTALISAIAQPRSFEHTITSCGFSFSKHYIFPDHYNFPDIASLAKVIKERGTSYEFLITTEKDWTKLRKYSPNLPLVIVSISFHTEDKNRLANTIKSL